MNKAFSIVTSEPEPIFRMGAATINSRLSMYFTKDETAPAPEVGINAAREYANWGGEFVDDALRFGDEPFLVSEDWPGEIGRRQ